MSRPKYTPGPWRIPGANLFRVVAPDAPNYNRKSGLAPPYPHAIVCDANIDNPDASYNAKLIAAAPRLAEALKQCADELADEIEHRYPEPLRKYPTYTRRYERDMETVHAARAALREAGVES